MDDWEWQTSVLGCRWLLQSLEWLITLSWVSFKPKKSRALVVKKGKVTHKFCISIMDIQVLSEPCWSIKSHWQGLWDKYHLLLESTIKPQQHHFAWEHELPSVSFQQSFRVFIVTWAREVHLYTNSIDIRVSSLKFYVKSGRKGPLLSCLPWLPVTAHISLK